MTRFQRIFLILLFSMLAAVWSILILLLVQYASRPVSSAPLPAEPSPVPSVIRFSYVVSRVAVDLPPTWTVTPPQLLQATATRTPTPDPATPTPTPLPLHRPTAVAVTVSGWAHPSSTLMIPTAVAPLTIPENAVTIVLLGSDRRPDWENWRTDAIQYLVVFSDPPAAALLSIPRDLYVYIPGFWMSRVNFADLYGEMYQYEDGGWGLLNQTLLYNLGITADYYVKVDFDGLIGLVDAMGGIDVPVHCRLQDYWPYADENGVFYQIALEPGVHHMDGELALWYSRSRKTTSTFSRERRQQQVLEAMWRGARGTNLIEAAPTLYEQTRDLYETNLGLGNILSLAVTAAQLDPLDVKRRSIGSGELVPYTTPYGGGVFLPIWDEIEPIIADVLRPPAENRTPQDTVQVEVWNGTGQAGWDLLAADRLLRFGYSPLVREADRHDYTQTTICYFEENTKGSNVDWLQTLFGVRPDSVQYQENPSPAAPVRLIIGQDYIPCRYY